MIEMERKKIVSKGQTGFRKKLETIDNIYTLNYIIYKYTRVKEKKLIALFVDKRHFRLGRPGEVIGTNGEERYKRRYD